MLRNVFFEHITTGVIRYLKCLKVDSETKIEDDKADIEENKELFGMEDRHLVDEESKNVINTFVSLIFWNCLILV